MKGFYRIAAVSPVVSVGDPKANGKALLEAFGKAAADGCTVAASPELSLTGATCGDLFWSDALIKQTEQVLWRLIEDVPNGCLYTVGLPVRIGAHLFDCTAVFANGRLLGTVAKTGFTRSRDIAGSRWFSDGALLPPGMTWADAPIGTHLLFDINAFRFGIESEADLWALNLPGERLAAAGAQLILNPAADAEIVGRSAERRDLVRLRSGRLACAYAYIGAGQGESTTDTVCSGHCLLADNGRLISERRWEPGLTEMDIRPRWTDAVRMRETRLTELPIEPMTTVDCSDVAYEWVESDEGARRGEQVPHWHESDGSLAGLDPAPFVPADPVELAARCDELMAIQSAALLKRFTHIHAKRLVIGLSGGLDSTLALLVCAEALRKAGLPSTTILGVTMPGFGTGTRTRGNVDILAEALGIELRCIPIGDGVLRHFEDIGHDPSVRDVTYENAQARARTYLLMDLANQEGGLLVGTGDLSEIALGWSTFNGDHMSMYSVNPGVPKTLMRACVRQAGARAGGDLERVLNDICDTPVSPELLPGAQNTEDIVGRYELHDFFLYYFVKYGCGAAELRGLADLLLKDRFPAAEIDTALATFGRRFVRQQFKRSTSPDGPKVGTVGLSPRGDWVMPSDAALTL